MSRIIVLFFCLVCVCLVAYSNTIKVSADHPTIQSGIEAASDGDTVLVAPGTYTENINFLGKKIVLSSHFILNNDLSMINNTIIDGSNPANPDTGSTVVMYNGEDSTTVLQGFTITNGTGTKWVDPHHAAWTWRGGGGIFTFQASPVIKNNLIINNRSTNTTGVDGAQGGGILCFDGNPLICNNVIMQNKARYGAGVVIDYSGGIIRNNIIYKNSGGQDYGGGGFWSIGNGPAPIIIENNHIIENSVTGTGTYGGRGGAMFVWYGTVTARNNIIWGNSQSQGKAIAQVDGGKADVTYSDVQHSFTGSGNFRSDPAFADSNFFLSPSSPCIDSGNPDSCYYDPEDPAQPDSACWPSCGGLMNDVGAYGGPGRGEFPFFYATGIYREDELTPGGFRLEQNYPNPFNQSTMIRFDLPEKSFVEAIVYDITGRKVQTLMKAEKTAGTHLMRWNGLDDENINVGSGLYFLTMKTRENIQVRKMILVR